MPTIMGAIAPAEVEEKRAIEGFLRAAKSLADRMGSGGNTAARRAASLSQLSSWRCLPEDGGSDAAWRSAQARGGAGSS